MTEPVGMIGHAPVVTIGKAPDAPTVEVPKASMTEQEKYQAMWTHEQYRGVAPGEGIAPMFLATARPKPGTTIIDFGAGTGRGAMMIAMLNGSKVIMLDFADNCLDPEVKQACETQPHAFEFLKHDLTKEVPVSAEYGYCTDVMEHIPPEDVNRVLANVMRAAQHVFFQISCEDDVCGALIGQPLHLSVHPYSWWLERFKEADCVIHWSADYGSHCCFYLTAWQTGDQILDAGGLNVEEEEIRQHVLINVNEKAELTEEEEDERTAAGLEDRKPGKQKWKQLITYPTNDEDVMLLAAGPSLNQYETHIRQLIDEGVKLVTMNGTYHWALERGLQPKAQIVCDAREFNKRFTKPVVDGCRYFCASQVHPSVLEGLPPERTWLWHTSAETVKDILDEAYDKIYYPVVGGSTVMLRAIPMLRMLGFKRFHLFGFDSCVTTDAHHAFSQPENDDCPVIDTIVAGRPFKCHIAHIAQATEFMDLVRIFGNVIELEVYGNGLIAHILKVSADMADDEMGPVDELKQALPQ